ncbi:MAG: hypothetical protein HUU21_40665 [Polyangiaceae bacterium]|nr:hypothetical protein [Polyangiaceae bacterium]NUQ79857.1 hypothetical protein [Polyangiaceae bacterium]
MPEPPNAPPTPDSNEKSPSPSLLRARRRGRRVAFAIFYSICGWICISGAVQITQQVFGSPAGPSPYAGCHEGLLALVSAVDRARSAAPGTDGEDAAIERFRGALLPEWRYRDAIAGACGKRAADKRALDAIERLRYAEEHAVRREAGDLAPLRRRVQAIVENELGAGSSRGTALPPSAGERP